jgi:hypothetical protein
MLQVYCFPTARQALEGHGLLLVEVPWSRSDTPHSGARLWTSENPVAQNWDNTQRSLETDIHTIAGFEPAISASQWP